MLENELFYIVVGALGFFILLLGLVFDEIIDLEGLFDFDFDVPWLDLRVIAAGFVGFGAAGFVSAELNVPLVWILVGSILGFILVSFASFFFVLKPLLRQQSNSQISRQDHRGRIGVISLTIVKDGTGTVQFKDKNGSLVTEVARDGHNREVLTGTQVIIIDIESNLVVVDKYNTL